MISIRSPLPEQYGRIVADYLSRPETCPPTPYQDHDYSREPWDVPAKPSTQPSISSSVESITLADTVQSTVQTVTVPDTVQSMVQTVTVPDTVLETVTTTTAESPAMLIVEPPAHVESTVQAPAKTIVPYGKGRVNRQIQSLTSMFISEPPIVSKMTEDELVISNPLLSDEFLQQREQIKQIRAAAQTDTTPSIYDAPPTPVVPKNLVDEHQKQFEKQQNILRMQRLKNAQLQVEQEQNLPKPDDNTVPVSIMKPQLAVVGETKQISDQNRVIQLEPQPIERCNAKALKQWCIKNNIPLPNAKYTKAELIKLLHQHGIKRV